MPIANPPWRNAFGEFMVLFFFHLSGQYVKICHKNLANCFFNKIKLLDTYILENYTFWTLKMEVLIQMMFLFILSDFWLPALNFPVPYSLLFAPPRNLHTCRPTKQCASLHLQMICKFGCIFCTAPQSPSEIFESATQHTDETYTPENEHDNGKPWMKMDLLKSGGFSR